MLRYLLEQAPNPILRRELKEAIVQTASALLERDMKTQELIAVCKKIVELMEDEAVDDVEPYCHGWSNTRRHDDDDDDDEPGAGGATGRGGGGAYSRDSRSGSSSSDTNKRTTSWRQGTTTQHSSGWSLNWFDSTAVIVLALWLIFLTWSIIRKLYRLCKVSVN